MGRKLSSQEGRADRVDYRRGNNGGRRYSLHRCGDLPGWVQADVESSRQEETMVPSTVRRALAWLVLGVLMSGAVPTGVAAQAPWPTRTVKIVVPFSAAGTADL